MMVYAPVDGEVSPVLPEEPKAEQAEAKEEITAVAYVGPDIDRIVSHGQIFTDGILPEKLKAAIKETPAIGGLVVPFDQFAAVVQEVKKPAGRYRMLYDLVRGTVKTR